MKTHCSRFVACAAVLMAGAWTVAAGAQQTARACGADELRVDSGRVAVADGRVSLVPPSGMRVLTREAAARRFPARHEIGELDLGDESGKVISIWRTDRGPANVTPGALRALAAILEMNASVAGRPAMTWIRKGESVDLGGARWVLFEYTGTFLVAEGGRSVAAERHVRHFLTDFQGGGLTVVFSAPPADRAELANSVNTLEVHDCALPGG